MVSQLFGLYRCLLISLLFIVEPARWVWIPQWNFNISNEICFAPWITELHEPVLQFVCDRALTQFLISHIVLFVFLRFYKI